MPTEKPFDADAVYAALIQAEVAKGCTEEVARQRVGKTIRAELAQRRRSKFKIVGEET